MLMTWKHRLTPHIFPCCSWLVSSVIGMEQYGLPPGDKTTPTPSAWKGERSRWVQTTLRGGRQSTPRKGNETTWHRTWHCQPFWQPDWAREQEVSGPEEKGVYQWCREQSSQGRIFEIAGSWARGSEKLSCWARAEQPCYPSAWAVKSRRIRSSKAAWATGDPASAMHWEEEPQ